MFWKNVFYKIWTLQATSNEKDFLFYLNITCNIFCSTYGNITQIGDFDMKPENQKLNNFFEMNKFERLILKVH